MSWQDKLCMSLTVFVFLLVSCPLLSSLPLCPPNPPYSLVPRCTKNLTNKGTVSFALAQFLHYLIIIFNLYLSLTHPPRVTVSDRVPAVKGICWSWITPWSNQLPVRPFAGQPAPPCFQARFIRPLLCKAFIIFTKPCTLSFINVNTHYCLINC